jgi:hypothetical protein
VEVDWSWPEPDPSPLPSWGGGPEVDDDPGRPESGELVVSPAHATPAASQGAPPATASTTTRRFDSPRHLGAKARATTESTTPASGPTTTEPKGHDAPDNDAAENQPEHPDAPDNDAAEDQHEHADNPGSSTTLATTTTTTADDHKDRDGAGHHDRDHNNDQDHRGSTPSHGGGPGQD